MEKFQNIKEPAAKYAGLQEGEGTIKGLGREKKTVKKKEKSEAKKSGTLVDGKRSHSGVRKAAKGVKTVLSVTGGLKGSIGQEKSFRESSDVVYGKPKPVIHKSLGGALEMTQINSCKRHSNPSIIDKIIKKSLKKAKNKRITQEKAVKLSELLNEIKKNELTYQNKQIRLQNSMKFKKKKNKSTDKKLENPNMYTLKTDTSHKLNATALTIQDLEKKNTRSKSVECRRRDPGVLQFMEKKKRQRVEKAEKESIAKTAEKVVKKSKLENLEKFIKNQKSLSKDSSFSSLDSDSLYPELHTSKDQGIIKRNISYICHNQGEKSSSDEDPYNYNQVQFKSFDFAQGRSAHFTTEDQPLTNITEYCKSPSFYTEATQKQETLSTSTDFHLLIPAIKPPRTFSTCTTPIFHIFPSKPTLNLSSESTLSLPPTPLAPLSSFAPPGITTPHPILSQCSFPPTSIASSQSKVLTAYSSQLQEQFSWNLALSFLIEQLQIFEITSASEHSGFHEDLLAGIRHKYSSIKKYLNEVFDIKNSSIVENLSIEEHSKFVKSTQNKKLMLHQMLIDSCERLEVFEVKDEEIENESEVSDDSYQAGISHSRSLTYLHDDITQKIKKNNQASDYSLSFGYEEVNALPACNQRMVTVSPVDSPKFVKKEVHLNIFGPERIEEFVRSVFGKVNLEKVIGELKKPLFKNPLTELDKMQELQIGTPTETIIYTFPELITISDIIPTNPSDKSWEISEKIHKKMLLEVSNYLLQQFRPYSYSGLPFPWISTKPVHQRPFSSTTLIEKLIKDLKALNSSKIGNYSNLNLSNTDGRDLFNLKIKERQLDKIIFEELISEDHLWTNYDFEETQVKLDLADIILQDLSEELINLNIL